MAIRSITPRTAREAVRQRFDAAIDNPPSKREAHRGVVLRCDLFVPAISGYRQPRPGVLASFGALRPSYRTRKTSYGTH